MTNLNLAQANIIVQVMDKKAVKDKYKVAVIKRPVEFSKETYSKAYNEFSQFIASNPTLEKMVANAETICIVLNMVSVVSEVLKKL